MDSAPRRRATDSASIVLAVPTPFMESVPGWLVVGVGLLVLIVVVRRRLLGAARHRARDLQREIDERRVAETALRRSEAHLKQAQNITLLGSFELELGGSGDRVERGCRWSRALTALLGDPKPERHGLEPLLTCLHPTDRERVRSFLLEGEAVMLDSVRAVLPDGRERSLVLRIRRQPHGQDGVRVTGTFQDVTEQRKLEALLRHSQKMEAIAALAAGVSHEFRNTLTSMLGHIDVARLSTDDPEELAGALDALQRLARSATGVAGNLLTFSRHSDTQPVWIDLCKVLQDILALIEPGMKHQVEMNFILSGKPCWVEADVSQLQQVMVNLMTNARDAMPDGGLLTVRLEMLSSKQAKEFEELSACDTGAAMIEIVDEGCGIPEDLQPRVFEPFVSTKPQTQGSGLGLAVVHGIAAEHGWALRLDSREGRGTRVQLALPAMPRRPQQAYLDCKEIR